LTKRAIGSSVTLSAMSARARVIATVGVLWMLVVGGAVLMTMRTGDVTLVHGEQSCTGSTCLDQARPVVAVHTHHELSRMFVWIAVASAVALVAVVLSAALRRRPARTDELEYEVVPLSTIPESRPVASSPAGVERDRRRRSSRRRARAFAALASLPGRHPDSPPSMEPGRTRVAQVSGTNG
jgi:hypothetical protein